MLKRPLQTAGHKQRTNARKRRIRGGGCSYKPVRKPDAKAKWGNAMPRTARAAPIRAQIKVDIISDPICPWCFVGKRRLEKALVQLPDVNVTVHWLPFFLDRTTPEGGIDRKVYLNRKFGAAAPHVYDRVRAAGAEEGIAFEFGKIRITPNTMDSHRLIHWAEEAGKQDAAVERLFQLFFQEGADIGDIEVLAAAAADIGMDSDAVRERLGTNESRALILRQVAETNDAGIGGVPCFVFNDKTYLPGAQPANVLAETIRRVLVET
jgi:predicted DsbA family dithiol-disulfide isomerase